MGLAEQFSSNVERYFEGPDPRTGGRGRAVGGLHDQQFRDFGRFRVYRYTDERGVRRGGSIPGAFTGLGVDTDHQSSLILFTRPDMGEIKSWVHFDYDREWLGSGISFESDLDDSLQERAVEASANPLLFNEFSIFAGICAAQEQELAVASGDFNDRREQLRQRLDKITEAEQQARITGRDVYLR